MEKLKAGSPLARALAANRPRYNALFAAARRTHPRLAPDAVASVVCGPLERIVHAVDACRADRVPAVVDDLFALALELLAANLLGPESRSPAVAHAWTTVLPACAPIVADDARRVAASVTNTAYNLERESSTVAARWTSDAARLGPSSPSTSAFLDLLLVLAWRSGLAQYRAAALEKWNSLPAALRRLALGLAADGTDDEAFRASLGDPWWQPATSSAPPPGLRVVARVGGFRGLNGPFVRPPQVACAAGRIVAFDRDSCWTVHADRFGTVLTHAGSDPPTSRDLPSPTFTIDRAGRVARDGASARFEELREPASFASTSWTLAVTIPRSHFVYLVARAGQVVP